MQKTEGDHGTEWMRYGKAVLIGGGAAFGLGLLLLFLCALGIAGGVLPAGAETRMMVVICALSGGAGGMIARRLGCARGLILGTCAGLLLFLFQLTGGLLLYDAMEFEQGGIGMLFAALCGGAAAGLPGAGSRRRKRPRRTV